MDTMDTTATSDQANFIEDLLKHAADQDEAGVKSIAVVKEVPVLFDLGHLLVSDPNIIPAADFRANKHKFLDSLSRDNAQLLVNEIWKQDRLMVDGWTIAKLPEPKVKLPRYRACPKGKAPTKWEQFAARKGIQKKTKDKLVFDEETNEWRPRYGYKSSDNQSSDWVEDAKEGDDMDDAFTGKKKEKRERAAKNEYQRLKNIARNSGKKVANNDAAVIPEEAAMARTETRGRPVVKDLEKAAMLAKSSTASLGKFQEKAVNEKPVKGQAGKKRHFDANEENVKEEKNKNLKLMDEILKEKPKINVKKAVVNQEMKSARQNQGNNNKKKGSGGKNFRNNKSGKGSPSKKSGSDGGKGKPAAAAFRSGKRPQAAGKGRK